MSLLTKIFKKPPTQVETVQHDMGETQRTVCQLLGITTDEYTCLVYQTGLEYISLYFSTAPRLGDVAERSRLFWNWWKMCWHNRDGCFAVDAMWQVRPADRRLIYAGLHDAAALREEIFPSREVQTELYSLLGIQLFNRKMA